MASAGVGPLDATVDEVRVYKAALLQAGRSPASVARTLSALRGTYQQFGKRGLVEWGRVRDIQSVEAPRVEKGGTPDLSQREAVALLHSPDRTTLAGVRDHALLAVFFKTACRVSAVAGALLSHIERTDTDLYLAVAEKGGRRQRKALLARVGRSTRTWMRRTSVTTRSDPHFAWYRGTGPGTTAATCPGPSSGSP